MNFTKHNIKDIRSTIQDKLDELKGYGLIIELGTITYEKDRLRTTLKCRVEGALTDSQRDYNKNRERHFLPPLGSVVRISGKLYEITGWRSRAPKRPVMVMDMSGGHWVFPVTPVQQAEVIREGKND